jgi:hypothetical protein
MLTRLKTASENALADPLPEAAMSTQAVPFQTRKAPSSATQMSQSVHGTLAYVADRNPGYVREYASSGERTRY